MDFNFLIGGEAGQGIQSMGYILTKTMAKGGYHVFATQDYESRIRGGHNFFKIRVGDQPVYASTEEVNLLIALNEETIQLHEMTLTKNGIILFDGERVKTDVDKPLISVPFERLAQEETSRRIMSNTVALGAALSVIHYDFELFASVLQKTFSKKSREIAELNVAAARCGYKFVQDIDRNIDYQVLSTLDRHVQRIVLNGVETIALGALAAGCKFMSGYPMTPSTGILQYFASKSEEYNVVFEQAEDEIAALNMVLGASYAGVRSMTATSGGGFALMVETLSLAGMTETPAVIVLGQRAGPATGLPTRTAQGELEFAIYAGHGTFPRAVFAPGTVEEAFYLTTKAFNIAEKYQVPVIILSDTYLSDSYVTSEPFDLSKVIIDRGRFLSEDEIEGLGKYQYKRHKLTESGISPRVLPGLPNVLVVTDSDEHTEDGHITESAEIRNKMVNKRQKKWAGLGTEIRSPSSYGPKDAGIVLVCWGSTFGAVHEAVDMLNDNGNSVRMMHLSEVWPFPTQDFLDLLGEVKKIIVVESNVTGQMAHLIRAETGVPATGAILRYDGRPITPSYIIKKIREVNA